MKRIGVVGASGRSGSRVVEVLALDSECHLVHAFVSPTSKSLGAVCARGGSTHRRDVFYSSDLSRVSECDGVIDFSTSSVSVDVARYCAESRVPLLLATTGLSSSQREFLRECAERTPILLASNTSLGAAVMSVLAQQAGKLLGPQFDLEVMEIHHKGKRDAPSGTALSLVESVVAASATPLSPIVNRPGERRDGEVGVVSLRGGDVAGEHTAFFFGPSERIEISHKVNDRAVFARGAVVLMKRLMGQKRGFFTPQDLLLLG